MANWLVTGASSGIGYGIALAACSNFAFFIQIK